MTATVGSIQVILSTNYGTAQAGMRAFGNTVYTQGERARKTVGGIDRSTIGLNRSMRALDNRPFRIMALSALRTKDSIDRLQTGLLALSTVLGGLGAAFTLRGIQQYADTYTEIENRLKVVKRETATVKGLQGDLFNIAQRSRSQYESTAVLFARIEQSSKRLNISQKDTLRATETIQKAFLVGGSTPIESAQSAIQLSQGIASNRLQGDELRSVLENPALGRLLAEQITDGDIGKLRDLASEGKLTADTIVKAFVNASDAIDALFNNTEQTFGQALVRLDNAILKTVGQSGSIDKGMGASIAAVNALTDNIDEVVDAMQNLGVIALATFGGRTAAAATKRLNDLRLQRIETFKLAQETQKLAQAEMLAARGPMLQARLAVNKAYREGNFTAKQLARAEAEAGKKTLIYRAAANNAAIATTRLNASQKALRLSSIAATGAMRGLGGAMAFFGGPIGLTLTALGATMFILSQRAGEAAERSRGYAEAIKIAGEESATAAGGIRQTAEAFFDLVKAATEAERLVNLQSATQRVEQGFSDLITQAARLAARMGDTRSEVNSLRDEFNGFTRRMMDGEDVSAEMVKRLDELASANPDMSPFIKELQDTVRWLQLAIGKLDELKNGFGDVNTTAKTARLGTPLVDRLTRDQRDALAGDLKDSKQDTIDDLDTNSPNANFYARLYGIDLDKAKKTEAQKTLDKFAEALAKLRAEAASVGLDKVDQEVVKTAQSIGLAEEKIAAFIRYAKGEGGEPPAQLMQIREELQKIADLEFGQKLDELAQSGVTMLMSDLDQKTIDTARSFGVAESAIRDFIQASRSGMGDIPPQIAMIRQELDRITDTERLVEFADGIADAFGDFFRSAIDGSESLGEALGNLANRLADLAVELLVIQPLMNAIKGGVLGGGSSLLGLGGFAGLGASTFTPTPGVGLFHDGGDVGMPTGNHREVLTLLEKGETVFDQQDASRIRSTLDSATSTSRERPSSGGNVYNIDARGAQKGVGEEIARALEEYDRKRAPKTVMKTIAAANKEGIEAR